MKKVFFLLFSFVLSFISLASANFSWFCDVTNVQVSKYTTCWLVQENQWKTLECRGKVNSYSIKNWQINNWIYIYTWGIESFDIAWYNVCTKENNSLHCRGNLIDFSITWLNISWYDMSNSSICVVSDWNVYCYRFWDSQNVDILYNWWDAKKVVVEDTNIAKCFIKSNWNVKCEWYYTDENWHQINYNPNENKYNWWDAVSVALWQDYWCVLKTDWNVSCRWNVDWYNWWDAINIKWWWHLVSILKSNWDVISIWWDGNSSEFLWNNVLWFDVSTFHTCVLTYSWNINCKWTNSYWQVINYNWWDVSIENQCVELEKKPDLTLDSWDFAYWYWYWYWYYATAGSNSWNFVNLYTDYYKNASWIVEVNLWENLLVFDVDIKNIWTIDSPETYATCIYTWKDYDWSFFEGLTYSVQNTPIIVPLDTKTNRIKFTIDDAKVITSRLWRKKLYCSIDRENNIDEVNEKNNDFEVSFIVTWDICKDIDTINTCLAWSESCPIQCSYVKFRGNFSSFSYYLGRKTWYQRAWSFNFKKYWKTANIKNMIIKQVWNFGYWFIDKIWFFKPLEYPWNWYSPITTCELDSENNCIFNPSQPYSSDNHLLQIYVKLKPEALTWYIWKYVQFKLLDADAVSNEWEVIANKWLPTTTVPISYYFNKCDVPNVQLNCRLWTELCPVECTYTETENIWLDTNICLLWHDVELWAFSVWKYWKPININQIDFTVKYPLGKKLRKNISALSIVDVKKPVKNLRLIDEDWNILAWPINLDNNLNWIFTWLDIPAPIDELTIIWDLTNFNDVDSIVKLKLLWIYSSESSWNSNVSVTTWAIISDLNTPVDLQSNLIRNCKKEKPILKEDISRKKL